MADNIITQLETIEKDIAAIKSKLDRATGRFEAAMGALNSLGYKTIEEAELAIKDREEKLKQRAERLDTDFNAFIKQYEEVFKDE